MKLSRRNLLKTFVLVLSGALARAQQIFHTTYATLVLQTVSTTGFNPVFTKTGATLYWKWPDGTYTSSNSPTKDLPGGTQTVQVQSQDGFKGVTEFICDPGVTDFTGPLPSFALFTSLVTFSIQGNLGSGFSGSLPSFSANTALQYVEMSVNQFTGVMPSFAACTALTYFDCTDTQLSGVLPSFASCTQLIIFDCDTALFSGALPSFAGCSLLQTIAVLQCNFSGTIPSFAACPDLQYISVATCFFTDTVAGSFATQKDLGIAEFYTNQLSQTAVDQILADFVLSLGIPGRVTCTADLSGGTNAHPSPTGIANAGLLVLAGWTVSYNP